MSVAPLISQEDTWKRQRPEIPIRGLTTALGRDANLRNKMQPEGIIIILINRHGALGNREGVGNRGSLFISPHRLGAEGNQGQRNLKLGARKD